jgi:hypothetical protein
LQGLDLAAGEFLTPAVVGRAALLHHGGEQVGVDVQ